MTTVDLGADDTLLIPPELLAHLTDDELAEYLGLLEVASTIDGSWRLNPRQQVAEDACDRLMAEGRPFELLYGGAGAGGKSEWLLWHLQRMAMKFPGFSGLLLRRTYGELERTAILRSLARFDKEQASYNATLKRWTFKNGSRIEFGYCKTDRDVYQYDSDEYDVVAWDELTQFPTDGPYRYLWSRLRTSIVQSTRGLTPHMIAATNPHRTGVAWVKPRWVEIGPWEQVHQVETELDEGIVRIVPRVFIPAKMTDNPFVDQEAYRAGLSQLDPDIRLAIEEGSWDVIAGQFFGEWRRDLHVVAPFKIPSWWKGAGGYDFGIANPMAYLVGHFDGDGNAYITREVYGSGLALGEQAERIHAIESGIRPPDYRVADPSIWTRTGAGPPIASQFLERRIAFRKANNARVDGWTRLREYLRCSVPRMVDGPNGEQTILAPRLFVFSTCTHLIRTLPLLVHDEKNPEDVDTEGEDHAGDALRYLVMSRPLPSRPPADDEPKTRADAHADRIRARLAKQGKGRTIDHPVLGRIEV